MKILVAAALLAIFPSGEICFAHSNVGLTMNVCVKSVSESQVSAMDSPSEKLGTCNDHATSVKGPVN